MTNTDDIIKIDTPENVTFDFEVSGIGSRFLAALVDSFLIIVLQLLVFGAFILIFTLTDLSKAAENAGTWFLAIVGFVGFLLLWGYYIGFELFWNGQTPGKRWVGLRVIRVDGTPITVTESIIRNLVRMIDFLPIAYGIGVVTMFISANSRRLGDLVAGTIVVHESKLSEAQRFTPLPANVLDTLASKSELPAEFPFQKITQNELNIIEEFLARRGDLPNRMALARHILASISARLELPQESIAYGKAEEILAAIHQARHARISE